MMKHLTVCFGLSVVLATSVAAQDSTPEPEVDPCAEIECITEPVVVATGEGSFVGAAALSSSDDTDKIAAIEQQALREFRWDVMAPVQIELAFEASAGPLPSGWPSDVEVGSNAATAMVLVSNDGETFSPLPDTTLAVPGQVLAVLVFQKSETPTEEVFRFLPSSWTYELIAQPIPPLPGPTLGPVLIPIAFGDDLGCTTAGCGEPADGAGAPNVSGEPRSEAGASPTTGGGGNANELARELQSELARVGCYTIAIDGLWGPGSRKAMTAFNSAKDSDLPVQNPTPGALVAVARETEQVCTPG